MCDYYCYLGVIITSSGSIKAGPKALYDKALGATFSLIRNINKHSACRVSTILDLFDKMILPIALYNTKVWGTNILPVNKKRQDR